MTQGGCTHVASWDLQLADSRKVRVEIVDVDGERLPHGADPHKTRCVWVTLLNGVSFKLADRTLVHSQRFIDPDTHERLLETHRRLSAEYTRLREQIVALKVSVGHDAESQLRVALEDVLADDYRDHRNCKPETCPWCRAQAALR